MKVRGRLEPWLVGALFIGPLVLAAAVYFGPWDVHRLPRVEHRGRELFEPPLALPPLDLLPARGTPPGARAVHGWSLIYATTARCDGSCLHDLERVRAVHIALGRRQDRVQRVLLAPSADSAARADAGLAHAVLDSTGDVARTLGPHRIAAGAIFVADPLGNVVLAYPPGVAQQDLLEDLKRLLDVSRIG